MKYFSIILFFFLTGELNAQTYTYDDLNQLTKAIYQDGTVINYSYDKLGNRTGYEIIPNCDKEVTITAAEGFGSLRHMVACAIDGDTISFANNLIDQSILLATPAIEIDKTLYWIADPSWNIVLENESSTNSSILVEINDDLFVEGLKLIGKTDDSMILRLSEGGTIEFKAAEMEKVDLQKN